MSGSDIKILIVDDSPTEVEILVELLSGEYEVTAAMSGTEAMALVNLGFDPNVILLDVNMTGVDGYETCRMLKEDPATVNSEVVFISGNDSVEEIMKGYEVGASDYLSKPIQPRELMSKLQVLAVQIQKRSHAMEDVSSAREEAQSARDMAMSAIIDAGEQAAVIDFIRQCGQATTVSGLGSLLIDAVEAYGLEASLRLMMSGKAEYMSSDDLMTPLELEILQKSQNVSRLYQSGSKLIANYPGVVAMIKNLPMEDEERCGRLRDHLAIIVESASNQLKAINLSEDVSALLVDFNNSLDRVQIQQTACKKGSVQLLDALSGEIQKTFNDFGLSEAQESELMGTISQYAERILANYSEGIGLDDEMKNVSDGLRIIANKLVPKSEDIEFDV